MTSNSFRLFSVLIACCLALLTGCGSAVYQPSHVAGFELEPEQEIDDQTIEKAFRARPQLPSKPSVSYFAFDDDYAYKVGEMLAGVPAVATTHRIPNVLVTGERKYTDHSSYGAARPMSMKKLRLLAARAKTDLVVVVDYGYRISDTANGLAALGVAIIPLFFVPFRDLKVESYVDSYIIDTRNGYLYGHLETKDEAEVEYENIYSDVADEMVERQLEKLVGQTGRLMTKLLAEERDASKQPLQRDPSDLPPGDTSEKGALEGGASASDRRGHGAASEG